MSLKGCFAMSFVLYIMDKRVQKISTSITVLYSPFSAHEEKIIGGGYEVPGGIVRDGTAY